MASVKVAVRVRPMNRREKDLNAKFIISMEKNKTTITNLKVPEGGTGDTGRERTKTFTYDFSYFSADSKSPSFVCQEMVFKNLGTDVLKSAFEGYNACVFAYGQTGSGKSYTMMGNAGDAGLIPRICEGLFSKISEKTKWNEASFRTEVSYLEIYNERVRDLLRRKSSKTNNLRIREHPKEGPYVEDLSKHLVQNYGDVEELMDAGNINRTTAATGMNDVSSRSHAIFTINFTQAKFDSEMPCETVSKIHLVDLAGSERADATGATGVRLKEGGNINKSLVTLGNVISALADLSQDATNPLSKKKQVFVPYRDSVLTWLLKDSLGGNSKTIMIATISPADVNYGETLSTLRYANRAKNIINKPTINEDPNVKLIRELRAEIARLKALLAQGNQIALLDSPTALSMEEKLQQNEARVQELTKEWTNKWNETQDILKEQTLALRKEGIGVVLDSELPHLIGIDDDLLSTGIILYHLKEGQTHVGREDALTEQDIVLHGLDLESEHCIFENLDGTVNLIPLNGAQCSVNGIQITEATHLNQGAVILLGRTNMFRFNHPKEAAKLREKRKSGLLSSFSLSMTDLSKSCENLSAVMLYNPGLEFERQQREELEKLESKRKQIEEMEEKQRSDKAELVRMQQEVESQRKETEIVQLQIRKQEESLKRRSVHIESRLKDLLAEKEKFEEERLREQQEIELQKKKQQEEIFARVKEELQRLQELNHNEKAEKMQIFRELERLKKEKDEQYIKLESEKKRLEEQEREQVMLVAHLEEQLREKQVIIELLKRGDVQRVEEEKRDLEDIRESLLKVKEARSEGDEKCEELEKAQHDFVEFKRKQLEQLTILVKDLVQQMDHLEKEIADERRALEHLKFIHEDHLNLMRDDENFVDAVLKAEEVEKIKSAEYRLQSKVRQLGYLKSSHLPALLEEKQRASEVLDRGLLGLDNTLYQIEKEIEEKEERLAQYRASTNQLQQLQETFEFTANIARQEEKVRKKEKEILESREKQQREALEQAVAKLERRHSALQRRSTIDFEIEEQKQKLATLNNSCSEQAGLQASLEAEQKALEQDRERSLYSLDQEIQQLKQKIYEGDGGQKGNHGTLEERLSHTTSPTTPTRLQPPAAPLVDDRINAFIEQEVQRRLQNIHHKAEDNDVSLSWSTESLKDNERLNNGTLQRKLKYEKIQQWQPHYSFPFLSKDAICASNLFGENEGVRDHKRQKAYTETWDLFSGSGRISSPFTSEKAFENERSNSEQESFACHRDTESSLIPSKNINTLKSKNVPYQNVSSTSLQSHDLNNVAYSLCKVENFHHFDDKIITSPDCDSSRTESECSHLKQLSPVGSLMGANEQAGFNSTSCLLFSQSNVHSEIITCKENSPFKTMHQTIEDQSSNSQHATQEASDLMSFKSTASCFDVRPEPTYSLGYFFSKLSCLYKDTSSQLLNTTVVSKPIKELGSFCDRSGRCAQAVSLIKNLPFVRNLQVNVFFQSDVNQDVSPSTDDTKSHTENVAQPESTVQESVTMCARTEISDACARKPSEGLVCCCKKEELENSLVLRQKFVHFPDVFLKLQVCSLEKVMEFLTCALPQICIRMEELKGIYWLAVGSCKKPEPEPACLLLFSSVLYVVVSSVEQDVCHSSLAMFREVPIITVKEIQVGFAGQNINLLCSAEDDLLTIFTYNKHFTQRICHDIMSVLISAVDDAVYLNHQLLKDDLMRISLDWTSDVNDLVFSNGVRLSCKFRTELVDLVYLLHENMGNGKPSLGDVHVLLYTSVKLDCDKQTVYRALILTTTHIGLLRESGVFYPAPNILDASSQESQFDRLQLCSLNDIRCVVLPNKENFTKLELVFSRKSKVGSDSGIDFSKYCEKEVNTQLTVIPSIRQSSLHIPSEVWKLTFSSSEEAIWLIMHLTRC
ncbi:kinesin-like protein KIF16B isoform X3 [Pezoporus flaviventris]|uniref:kinesin-like protein KIF16B isoform X3 n=1 Tax=Pezoporus flaviventris TaxID=889875 RepID=UPI002AB22D1E|nr:kinesin-like protein KIF16B isoform X3 [Pezoporus flaviventris]